MNILTPYILMKFDRNLLKLEKSKLACEENGNISAIEGTINGQKTLIVTINVSPQIVIWPIPNCFSNKFTHVHNQNF